MYNFKELNSIKKKVGEISEKRSEKYEQIMADVQKKIADFRNSSQNDVSLLKEAADRLIVALEQKRTQPEPYVILATIFYLVNEDRLAFKYLRIAGSLNPNLPQIKTLKRLISGEQLAEFENEENENIEQTENNSDLNILPEISHQVLNEPIQVQETPEQNPVENNEKVVKPVTPALKPNPLKIGLNANSRPIVQKNPLRTNPTAQKTSPISPSKSGIVSASKNLGLKVVVSNSFKNALKNNSEKK